MAASDGSNSTLDFPAACFSADCSQGGCCHGGGGRERPEGKHDVNRTRPKTRGKGIVLASTERGASKGSENTSGNRKDDRVASGNLLLTEEGQGGEARVPLAVESPRNALSPDVGSFGLLVGSPSKSRFVEDREIPAMVFLRTDASDVYSCLLAQVLSRGRPPTPSTQRNTAEALATPARATAGLPFGDRCPRDPSVACLTRGRTVASRQDFSDRTTPFSVHAVHSACKFAPPSPGSPGPLNIAFSPAGSGSSSVTTAPRRPTTQPALPRVPECFNPETPTEGVQSVERTSARSTTAGRTTRNTTTGWTSTRNTATGKTSAGSPTTRRTSARSPTTRRTSATSTRPGGASSERTSAGRKSPGGNRKRTIRHQSVFTQESDLMTCPSFLRTSLAWWTFSRSRLPQAAGRGLLAWCLWVGVWASLLVGGASVIPSSNTTFALQKYQADRARCLGSGRCDETCPPEYYKHEENGCLTEDECLNLHQLLYHTPEGNYCVITCPKHYETEGNTCRKSEVCRSKRIVNRVSNLRSLAGCRVIEGNLQIVLIEGATEEDWKNWSFPELVEITEFLLVYRVRGLTSLGQLFPNLSVIRGSVRHQGYALIVYGVNDLEVIGLYSLTRILQGSVRIQNNFHLCYVHTVDWSLITGPGAENVFKNNNEYLYPLCDESCPERNNMRRCWDSTHCQRVCPTECQGECTDTNECCHDFCAGGCSRANKAESCHACKDYSQGHTCVRTCGKGYYKYGGYRCVTMGVCVKKLHGILLHKSGDGMDECVDQGECPAKYYKTEEDYLGVKHPTCKKCEAPGENCAKKCSELLVNTIAKAQQLMGCTKIEGRLIISITGGKAIAKELNASLGKIEVVTDYIRVFSSNALRSLNFLKSLRVIGGASLYNDKYALYVHGNDNLEEIWSWEDHKNFTITEKKASVLFHSNPKLCYKKIKELLERTNRVEMTADCNMNLTNGNKAACMDKTLDLYLTPLALKGTVNVSWNTVFINDDDRMLTGYYIFYKVAYEENVTYLDGRDACHDDWSRKYVENKVSDGIITQIVDDLKPATKYAIYVQTDTVVDAAIGARSNISYITTLPFNPSKPPNVKVTDKTDRSMTVMWGTPVSPNGEIDQYIVTVKLLPYLNDSAPVSCSHDENVLRAPKLPIEETTRPTKAPSSEFPPRSKWQVGAPAGVGAAGGGAAAGGECCACPESRREERQQEIDFEDELYGLVYKRRSSSSSRQKRSINGTDDSDGHNQLIQLLNTSDLDPAIYQDLINISNSLPAAKEPQHTPSDCEFVEDSLYCNDADQCLSHGAARCWRDAARLLQGEGGSIVKNTSELSLTITGLHHFTIYEIKVAACHRPTTACPLGSNMKQCVLCSLNPKIITDTTDAKAGANLVTGLREINTSRDSIKSFTWTRPAEPNGKVVAYKVKILPMETIGHIKTPCISEKEFVERNMTFHLNMSQLLPGRYNLSVETYTRPDSPSNKSLEAVIFVVEGGPDTPLHLKLLAVALLVGVVLVVVLALVTRVCTKPDEKIVTTLNPIYAQESGLPAWIQHVYDIIGSQDIIDSSDLHVEEGPQLGEGKFGLVLNGRLRLEAKNIPVAVKQVTDFQAREDILQEAKLMLKLNCYHLVRAYGVVPKATHILLVMEYMNCGDLLRYIRSRKPPDDDMLSVITIDHVCAMAVQIADGMAYLASHKIVHRDLAARNCLINDNMNIKISDFGMARLTDNDYYRIRESKYFPVRWLPPEYHLKFTSQSDVWSYGIVLWEILSGGARPYEHLTNDNDVLQQVRRGYTLETHIPKGTPSFLAKILISCWRYKGSMRPYFPQLVAALLPSTSPCFIQHFRMVSFYHTADGQEYKRQLETQQDVDEDSDITSPLNESSPSPFCHPIRQDGPPLPPRPLTGTRWRPSFRFRGATVPRYTQQPTHLPVTDLESLTLSQQVLSSNRERGATSPSRNVTSTLVDLTTSKSQEESVRKNVKTSPFHSSDTDVVVMNTHAPKDLHAPLAATTPNPSNVIVQLNSRGSTSTTIASSTDPPGSPRKLEITLPNFKCSKKMSDIKPSPC